MNILALQCVAVRLDDVASSAYESVLGRPQGEDHRRSRARDVKGTGRSHFGVDATLVKRYVKLAEEGKPLTPGKAPGKKGKLDGSATKLLEEDLHSRPAVTYEKRAESTLRAARGQGEQVDHQPNG